jgi:hypothetical protein
MGVESTGVEVFPFAAAGAPGFFHRAYFTVKGSVRDRERDDKEPLALRGSAMVEDLA